MNHTIILAAGKGERLHFKGDKMLIKAGGKPLIYHSLMTFNDHSDIDSVTVVVNKNNQENIKKIIKDYKFPKVKKIILGGKTRQESLIGGLTAIQKIATKEDIIVVHNGANPLVSAEEISQTIEQAKQTGACIVGHFLSSTIKEVDGEQILKTHNREKIFAAETPQTFKYSLIKKAVDNAKAKKINVTDEAMLIENLGEKVSYMNAHENNFKITTAADVTKLKAILGDLPEDYRIGLGQDSHMFENSKSDEKSQTTKEPLTLAGLTFPECPKLKANSDGDVILHAIFNALSQAIGDMSLGFYADEECEKGIRDSKKYLEIILKKTHQQKFKINSLGLMMECKTPKIDPIVTKLKKSLSQILSIEPRRIGITATSGEHLTIFGAGLGIQCFAIVSLLKV